MNIMIVKIIVILLLATGATVHCINLIFKENADIERVKNNSRMEDFYSHACKSKGDCVRRFTRNLLNKAARGKSYDSMSTKIIDAFKDVDDISATKIKQVWRSDLGGKEKVWIVECETKNPKKSFCLHFIKNNRHLVLDEIN